MTAAESALERELSGLVMSGGSKPEVRKLRAGEVLTRQGDVGGELYLVLDGVLVVDVDGKEWAEVGPGAVLGGAPPCSSGGCARRRSRPGRRARSPPFPPIRSTGHASKPSPTTTAARSRQADVIDHCSSPPSQDSIGVPGGGGSGPGRPMGLAGPPSGRRGTQPTVPAWAG